jgi:site-specific recombinase XerC
MARQRSGSIEMVGKVWYARVTIDLPDGTSERRYVCLDTSDKTRAESLKRKLVAEIAAGRVLARAKLAVRVAETVTERADAWCKSREARGVAMVDSERGYFKHHVLDRIGPMALADVRKADIRAVLDAAAAKGLARGTVAHVRRMLVRFFNELEGDDVIPVTPMRGVKMPIMKDDKRQRTPLTDDEYSRLFACTSVDIEIKVLVLFARTLGGARACEATRLDWGMLDRETFAKCIIARGKTRAFQALIVPDMLRPFLRAWWNAAGQPETGPVFPVRRGPRKGRQRATSLFAPRFRRALLKAGVTRHEVHKDTAYSRRTDFHTLRREYVSALASANVNEQTAMALASHSSSAVHKRYQLAQINALPASALPLFNADIANSIGCRPANSNRRAVQVPVTMSGTPDSNRRHSAWEVEARPAKWRNVTR